MPAGSRHGAVPPARPMGIHDLAALVDGEVLGKTSALISGAAPFETAGPEDVTFAGSARYLKRLVQTRAGAVLVPHDFRAESDGLIAVEHPQLAFIKLLNYFRPPRPPGPGVSPQVYIGPGVVFGEDVSIGPFAVIQEAAVIGERTVIHPNVVIGPRAKIGRDCRIYPNVTVLEDCRIGDRVIIHAGTVIGSDGFGFVQDGPKHVKIPHRGIVQIDDDVEIGANNTIDRATFGRTWLQQGVKTDNLVHVAHNVTVGKNTLIVAQVGLSGSVTIGGGAILAGQAGVAQHLTVGDKAVVGPQAGIAKDVPPGAVVSGSPAVDHRRWLRVQRVLPHLDKINKHVSRIEKKLAALEKQLDASEVTR